MELQPVQGRRAVDVGGRTPRTSPWHVAEGLQCLQRAVSRGPADLDRYAFAGTVSRRMAMGGLPAVLPTFSGAPGADEPDRHTIGPALPHEPRRHPA